MSDPKYRDVGPLETRVSEECAEIIHSICKAQRFGWRDFHPKHLGENNARRTLNEIADLERILPEFKEYLELEAEQ